MHKNGILKQLGDHMQGIWVVVCFIPGTKCIRKAKKLGVTNAITRRVEPSRLISHHQIS